MQIVLCDCRGQKVKIQLMIIINGYWILKANTNIIFTKTETFYDGYAGVKDITCVTDHLSHRRKPHLILVTVTNFKYI